MIFVEPFLPCLTKFCVLVKPLVKPFLPCLHCGFNDHLPDDCLCFTVVIFVEIPLMKPQDMTWSSMLEEESLLTHLSPLNHPLLPNANYAEVMSTQPLTMNQFNGSKRPTKPNPPKSWFTRKLTQFVICVETH